MLLKVVGKTLGIGMRISHTYLQPGCWCSSPLFRQTMYGFTVLFKPNTVLDVHSRLQQLKFDPSTSLDLFAIQLKKSHRIDNHSNRWFTDWQQLHLLLIRAQALLADTELAGRTRSISQGRYPRPVPTVGGPSWAAYLTALVACRRAMWPGRGGVGGPRVPLSGLPWMADRGA